MNLHITVDSQPMRITGNTIQDVAATWEIARRRGAELGALVTANALVMSESERESLSLLTNVPPAVRQILNLGGWAECDPDANDEAPLPMPALFDDAPPITNYQGAGGSASQYELDRTPIGPALPLPKLF
jgi:hypothetical protein